MEDDLRIQITQTDSLHTVSAEGRVTVDSSPQLRTALLRLLRRKPGGEVAIDLSGVSYMDTSGIATLLEALKAARDRSVKLRLSGLKGQARMLAETVDLHKVFMALGSEVEFS